MGDETDSSVFEDRAIAAAIDGEDFDAFAKIVKNYDAQHKVWGFKRPKAFIRLDNILKGLRNPRIIVTMRDCVAIAVRNNKSVYHGEVEGVHRAAKATLAALDALDGANCPILMVSYEKAMSNPKKFSRQVAAFCGLAAPPDMIQSIVEVMKNGPEIYLQNARLVYEGTYSAGNGKVSGWIMSNAAIPEIEILKDGKILKTFMPTLPATHPSGSKLPKGMQIAGFAEDYGDAKGAIVLRVRNTVFELSEVKQTGS